MLLLGLVLVVLGALAILAAVTTISGNAAFLGFDDMSAMAIFFIGLGSGLAIVAGLMLARSGTRRTMAQRREHKRLSELNEQLDRVERDNRHDNDRDRPEL